MYTLQLTENENRKQIMTMNMLKLLHKQKRTRILRCRQASEIQTQKCKQTKKHQKLEQSQNISMSLSTAVSKPYYR